jgi:16S rRNA (guanine966-N2)-methyltransferase
MAMRILAGTAKGRQIYSVSKKMMVKPISVRMKKSLFDILRPKLPGSYFLDLFAGTGAVGLEALSRGAQKVVFIDKDPRCLKNVERNLERFGWTENTKVLRGDLLESLSWVPFRAKTDEPFDLVFLGPPYRLEDNTPLAYSTPVLNNVVSSDLAAEDAWIICQHHMKEEIGKVPGLKRFRVTKYGDTYISFFKRV